MQKCSRIIAGFLTVLIIVSLTACSAGNENPAAKTESDEAVLSDLTVYSYTWRMAEFLDDSSYDEYMHDDGQRFQSLMSFTEKLRSSEELAFTPYTSNLVELLNLTVPDQCMVNYGTEFAEESGYEINGEPAAAAEALQVTDNLFDLFPLQIAEGRGFSDDDYDYLN